MHWLTLLTLCRSLILKCFHKKHVSPQELENCHWLIVIVHFARRSLGLACDFRFIQRCKLHYPVCEFS